MKLHQVLTGAVNPGENTFSVGLLDGAAFTAYASGCDIVILGSNFERVQIIPGSKHGNIQVGCLSCSARLGKIAASYGDTVSIFEPFPLINKASNPLGLQWHKTGQLKVPSAVLDLAWDPQADSLLTASSSLQLWSCSPGSEVAVDSPTSESALTGCVWAAVWTCRTALPVTQIKFSPDGYFFATTGKNDCLVKVWYRTDGWHACRVVGVSGGGSCTDPAVMPTERPAFSFAYLAHPRAVTSLSWRKTSTYLPRGAACNTLLTSCRDGICRVWLETVLPEDCLQECPAVSGHGARGEPPPSVRLAAAAGPRGKAQRERMHHVLGSFQQLKMLKRRKRTLQRDGLGSVLAEALPGSPALPRQPRILAHFHIAASINPKTDIPLMPAMGCPGVDGDGPPFVVHWLNNKYLQFTLSLECLLQQLQPPAPPGGSRGGSGRAADAGSRGSRGSQEEAGGEVGGRDAPDGNSDNHSSSRESEDGICSLDDGSEKESDTPTGTAPRRPPGISTTTNTTLTATAAVAASTPADGSGPPGGTGRPKHAGAAGAAWQVENGLDWLVRDWQSAPDMLYSVHALDGSFLVWHVDWLDESQPGVFKQVQVCFSSRIPVAFPAGDAHSMGKHMYLYACPSGARHAGDPTAGTSPHHPRYYSSSSSFSSVPRSSSGHLISSSLGRNLGSCGSIGSIGGGMGGPFGALLVPPSVKLVTKHADGSLNQWAVCFGEDAAFRTVLGISHQSRYCGHRFRLTGQACHAVLPLLLTTAHHAPRDDAPPDGRSSPRPSPTDDIARKRPSGRFVRREAGGASGGSSGGSPGDTFAGPAMTRRSLRGEGGGGTCGPPGRQLRRLMSDCDVLAVRSELILWRVDPVGPLSHTGGVLELARINCASEDAFAHMAWLPTTVPGYCLGTYCNSPSSCFVASDGWNLRLYQAVIDARKLLDELSKPQLSRLVGDVFSIVSQQSTARPGCIIELDVITEQCPSSTQFLHVFSEELILGRRSKDTEEGDGSNPASGAGPGRAPQFSERFFLVSIERAEGGQSLLKMWSLHLTSVQALAAEMPAWQNSPGTPQSSGTGTGSGASSSSSTSSSAESRPPFGSGGGGSGGSTTLPRTASSANLQTASRLTLASRLLHSQPLPLQLGVEIIHATPAAGHLSSSSIYPVCLAPYLIATSCSDGTVRFWRCSVADAKASQQQQQPGSNGPQDASYSWEEWPLQCDEAAPSAISVPGRPVAVSCSYPGCVAVAYRREEHNASSARDSSLYVSVFECESSGGSSWLLEETLPLGGVGRRLHPHHAVDSNLMVYSHPPGGDGAAASVHHRHPHGPTERALLRHHHDHAKHLLHIDWVSKEDGSHMLTVAVGARVVIYGRLSWTAGEPLSRGAAGGGAPAVSSHGALPASYRPAKTRWVPLRCVGLVSAFDGSPALPVELSWVRDGVLVAGMDCEMHVYSQWQDPAAAASAAVSVADEQALLLTREFDKISSSVASRAPRHSVSAGNLRQAAQFGGAKKQPLPSRKSLSKCPTALRPLLHEQNPALVLPEAVRGCGLFEAAEVLSPTLPQYHPLQLSGLLDLGRVRQVRAVLAHLVRCVAGDLAYVAEAGAELSTRERKHSRAGSTSSGMLAGREEAGDYPQIDAVPPLPLFSLLAADGAGSMGPTQHNPGQVPEKEGRRVGGSADTDQYGDLFEVPSLTTADDLDATVDGETEGDELAGANRVVDLSRFGATYFGPEQAQVLAGHLVQASLPGLSRLEQMHLMALADTVATTASQGSMESVDACGLRFLLAVRLHSFLLSSLPPLHRAQLQHQGLSTCHFAWAFHSTSQEDLLGLLPTMQRADGPTWAELRAMGVGWWLRGRAALRLCMEKLAKVAFQRNNDPLDAALYYLAMGKKGVLWGLFRSKGDSKMTQFFSNNFTEERWRSAALKNAFALLGKRRFEQAAAFFLLAGALRDAIEVCLEKLNDIQLALVVARLQEANTDAPATYRSILGCRVLGRNEVSGADAAATPELAELTRACELRKDRDPFLRSIACWVKSDYSGALDALLEQPDSACDTDDDGGSGGSGGGSASPGLCSPGVFNFYNFLRSHPLIVRHHMLSHGGAGQRPADTISLRERRLFFATASTHLKSGCPLLALDVLRRMPHAEKEVVTVASARGGGRLPLENGHVHGGGSAWGTAGAHPSSGHHTAESADWASSAMTVADEPLELSWDSEEDEEEEEDEEDDDDEDQGITMKKTRAFKKGTADVVEGDVEKRPESLPPAPSGTDGYVDVMAEQMKFRACLKLLVDELRTLATGYEVDRGKLHVQLCHWLEREVATLQEVCGYPGDLHGTAAGSLDTVAEDAGSKLSGATDACPFIGGGGSGGVTPDDTEAWREQHSLRARQLHAARRRQWLCANLPLLHMFLGYCSLHGAQGGGLASVRVELLFLIQESQQEAVLKQLHSRLPLPTVLPLISASLATLKTVISNPVLHVANLAHDILRTVSDMPAPPEPPKDNPQVHMIYVLAASLSACVYQSLCDSHSFSSEVASCPFTGLSYKSCLLRERLRQRHESTSNLQSTSLPSQWPGVTQLLSQLHACRDEEQPPLRMLLCEALLAVFLGMLARALATNAAGRLYRLSARPLDARSWASLFGGAARVPQCATPSPAQTLAPPQQQAPSSSSSKGNSTAEAVKTQQGSTRNRAQQQSETSSSGGRVRADEASKHRHRLNMRILVTSPSPPSTAAPTQRAVVSTVSGSSGGGSGGAGGSVELGGSWAQSPLTPCANFREVFVPPELSIWDYYMAKPFVASDDGLGYDSDESEESEEEEEEEDEGDEEADYDPILDKDDERASRRRSREREHSDPNSYSWCLMRLVVVRLAITNMRGFFPMAGLEMSDLPSCSPLCHMALCTLSQWEQALCARLEATPGPPDDYIPTLGAHTGDGPAGPAILRYKAMLEPGNTPFSSHRRSALAAKRLWQFLVRHESMQETFIRHIFTRAHHRHQQQQQEEESSSSGNLNYVTEDHGSNRTELSAGSPITRARIVHKETDIITAFAINRANPSCLAAASAHEVLELDLSSILSSSCQAWVEEESESEGSSNEDFLVVYTKDDAFRSPSIGSFHTSSPYTPSSTGTTSSVGGQTGRGPTMLLRRNLSNVRRMASHPILPYYVTGGQDGSVRVFEWGHAEQLQVMRPPPAPRVTRLRFCAQSNRKFGVTDGDGFLSLWQLDLTNKNPKPYLTLKCHSRDTFDFTFLGSSSVVATAGQSSDGRNVRLWDTLVPHRSSLVHGFQCLEAGATVLGYAPRSQTLIVGGRKGHVTLLDLRQRVARHTVQAHESAVKAIAVHPGEGFFLTGSAEGNIKVWSLPAPTLISTYANEHARQSIFRHLGAGVMQIETGPGRHVFSCGADGTIKTRVLLQHSGGW